MSLLYCILLTSPMMGKARRRSANFTLSESFFEAGYHVPQTNMEIQICNICQISLFHLTTNSWIMGKVQLTPTVSDSLYMAKFQTFSFSMCFFYHFHHRNGPFWAQNVVEQVKLWKMWKCLQVSTKNMVRHSHSLTEKPQGNTQLQSLSLLYSNKKGINET